MLPKLGEENNFVPNFGVIFILNEKEKKVIKLDEDEKEILNPIIKKFKSKPPINSIKPETEVQYI